MKKILLAFIAIVLMSSFILPKGKLSTPKFDEWEFVIHNKTKFHIDEFWVGEVKGDKVTWHHGHFDGEDTSIAPGESMDLTVYDEYYKSNRLLEVFIQLLKGDFFDNTIYL